MGVVCLCSSRRVYYKRLCVLINVDQESGSTLITIPDGPQSRIFTARSIAQSIFFMSDLRGSLTNDVV